MFRFRCGALKNLGVRYQYNQEKQVHNAADFAETSKQKNDGADGQQIWKQRDERRDWTWMAENQRECQISVQEEHDEVFDQEMMIETRWQNYQGMERDRFQTRRRPVKRSWIGQA